LGMALPPKCDVPKLAAKDESSGFSLTFKRPPSIVASRDACEEAAHPCKVPEL